MSLNFLSPCRRPRTTFKRIVLEYGHAVHIGDAVITKRLQKRGIKLFPAPVSVMDGFRGKIGRIYYAAAIDSRDPLAMAALTEERRRHNFRHENLQAYHELLLEDQYREFQCAPTHR